MGKLKRVCVFCGSNSGNRKVFSARTWSSTGSKEHGFDLWRRKCWSHGFGLHNCSPWRLSCSWVGVLNVDGYFECLLGLFDKGVEEGFINSSARQIVISAQTAHDLLHKMEEFVPLNEQFAPSESWSTEEDQNASL